MSEFDVQGKSMFGPYEKKAPKTLPDGVTVLGYMTSKPAFPVGDERFPVRLVFYQGKVSDMDVDLGLYNSSELAASRLKQAFESLFIAAGKEIPLKMRNIDFLPELQLLKGCHFFSLPEELPHYYITAWGSGSSEDEISLRLSVIPEGEEIPENSPLIAPTSPNPSPPNSPPATSPPNPTPPEKMQAEEAPVADPNRIEIPGVEVTFQRSLASIHALLVRPIRGGGLAAQAMPLTATATKDRTDGIIGFQFNQRVGSDMRSALFEVVRAIQVRHPNLPADHEVRFGFADKWSGKDGPSAAVATALLLESLLEGFEIPENVAVTGDLNASQKVQPVGGVPDKIRGAILEHCNVIGIPSANEVDIDDMVVEERLSLFLTAKVFTMDSLEDAVCLVNPEARTTEYAEALASFEVIQGELKSRGAEALFTPVMHERLKATLEGAPNCYSAKILLAEAERRTPARFSLAGTLTRIDAAMAPFSETMSRIQQGESINSFQFGRDNPLSEAKNRLRSLKEKSDPRLVKILSSREVVIDKLQLLINSNAGSRTVFEGLLNELRIAEDRAKEEWNEVLRNQEIQDQLMKRGISLR
ncbi:MAG: hypothetical protein KC931_17780, partial [Candidatus Omnitrophica bacterium]|nr:hypothetical protein [Candidatus Omnitrophota bacterium]